MKKKVKHNIKKTFILSIALLLGMIINIFGNNIINSLCEEIKLVKINTSWQYLKNDNSKESINLPVVIRETEKKDKIIIEKDISTIGYNDPTLLLRSELQSIDIYINGKLVGKDVSDFVGFYPIGTTYEIKNITPTPGHNYLGLRYGDPLVGIISHTTYINLIFNTIT